MAGISLVACVCLFASVCFVFRSLDSFAFEAERIIFEQAKVKKKIEDTKQKTTKGFKSRGKEKERE